MQRGVAQSGSAPVLGTGGRRFESCRPDKMKRLGIKLNLFFVLFNTQHLNIIIMELLELSKQRFSARKYTDEKVSESDLEYILETVRMAPSACNKQPWKFVVVESEAAKRQLQECYNREWFATAPIYILCLRNKEQNWVRNDGKQHGDIDVAIATEHLCLAAAERGLGTCWVCNFDVEKMAQFVGNDEFEAVAIVPLGHIADDCPRAEKKRKALDEIVERR